MKLLNRSGAFSLSKKDSKDKFKTYYVSAYLGSNKKLTRVLTYKKTDHEAREQFFKLISTYKTGTDLRAFIEKNVRKLTKHDNPNYVHTEEIVFRGTLGKKLKEFRNKKLKEPISEAYKGTIRYIISKINNKIIREETLTKNLIDSLYSEIIEQKLDPKTNKNIQLSPETLRNYRNILRQLCSYLNKDEAKLMKDFVIYSKTQLKKNEIETNSKARRHFERSEIRKIFESVLEENDITIRSNIFILFYLGIRPGDLINIEETKDKLVVVTSKNETVCVFRKDKFFEAYRLLTDLKIENKGQGASSEYFLTLTKKLFGERLDQYCIRHTVISHRVLAGEALKIVSQEAGHASLRMLDTNYAKRIMKEGSSLEDEILFRNVLKADYRCWLLQELLLLRWPELTSRKPNSELYEQVIGLLKSDAESKAKQIDL